jgi:gamma-glutamylcyclotransferase (GGCT)/AIG2-like uncharacterized protein YtfP
MIRGTMAVAGQLWSYDECAIENVRRVLDRIEVTNQPGIPNEYDRVEVEVNTLDGEKLIAETYLFSHPADLVRIGTLHAEMLEWERRRFAIWPQNCEWP